LKKITCGSKLHINLFQRCIKGHSVLEALRECERSKKIDELLSELAVNPLSLSPGNTKKLKYTEAHSRRINKKDRVTYLVNENKKEVVILRLRGHYED